MGQFYQAVFVLDYQFKLYKWKKIVQQQTRFEVIVKCINGSLLRRNSKPIYVEPFNQDVIKDSSRATKHSQTRL